jgi:hypothetical protein
LRATKASKNKHFRQKNNPNKTCRRFALMNADFENKISKLVFSILICVYQRNQQQIFLSVSELCGRGVDEHGAMVAQRQPPLFEPFLKLMKIFG